VLRAAAAEWPAPGQWVEAGAILGRLDIRVGPLEKLDVQLKVSELRNKLEEAQKKLEGARKVREVHLARVERFKESPKSVPPRELEEAQVQLTEAETQEKVAAGAVREWQEALAAIERQADRKTLTWSQPLDAPAAGWVTELAGQPGMAVEAGGLLVRLVDFRRPLVRLDVPAEALLHGPPPAAELTAAGIVPPALRGARNQPESAGPARKVPAALVGPAPQVDAASQLAGYYYEVRLAAPPDGKKVEARGKGVIVDGVAWQPGLFVKAEMPVQAGEPQEAVSVPAGALLYHQGRALVYVLQARDKKNVRFARREVQVLGRKDDRWVLAVGQTIDRTAQVVSGGAQALLSAEFKPAEADND
jgi:hypothetical protein